MIVRRKLKPFVIPSMYALAIIFFACSLLLIQKIFNNQSFVSKDLQYVSGQIVTDIIMPVVSTEVSIARPYLEQNITIVKGYYDYLGESDAQKKAIIYHDNTYMQNSGIDYGREEVFDVTSILDGEVINIKEDNLLGKVIEVRHTNELLSIYQSLSEINIKKGDKVMKGQIIGKSGVSNIDVSLGNHLHFELFYQGKVVNPEEYYDKALKDL